jgi:hypothetical protein
MPSAITETLLTSEGQPYNGGIRFTPNRPVRVVESDMVSAEPILKTITDGELSITLVEGDYVVHMNETLDFTIRVPSGSGAYQLYELLVDDGSMTPSGGYLLTTSPQDMADDAAAVARLNILSAGLADTIGTPIVPLVIANRPLTADALGTGTPVNFTGASGDTVTYLNLGNRYLALNGAKAESVKLWLPATLPATCGLYVEAWRKSDLWRRVWTSVNKRSTVTPADGQVTISLTTDLTTVQSGDYFAVRLVYAPGDYAAGIGDKSTPPDAAANNDGMSYAVLYGDLQGSADWDAATKVAGRSICLQVMLRRCPVLMVMGSDQLLAHPASDSLYLPTMVFDRRKDIGWNMETFLGSTVRNGAQRGLLLADQLTLWTGDYALMYPRCVALSVSALNDIKAGTTKAAWLASLGTLLDAITVSNEGAALVLAELPFHDPGAANDAAANLLNSTSDEWMRDAKALVHTYAADVALWVDLTEAFGSLRVGGATGNLWNLKAEFDSGDGLHLTRHGILRLATQVGNAFKRFYNRVQSEYPQRFSVRPVSGGAIGDADTVLTYSGYPETLYTSNATLSANRAVTLPTPMPSWGFGSELHFVRTGGGAFTYDIGGLTTLGQNQWCRVSWGLNLWQLIAKGSLT